MTMDVQDSFERGERAGSISARLANHDKHFETINGSLARIANELHSLNLGVQELKQQAREEAHTVVTTAAALKDANDTRMQSNAASWDGKSRVFAVIAAASSLLSIYLTMRGHG